MFEFHISFLESKKIKDACYLINNYKPDAVRIGIANALELIFVVYIITLELDFNLYSYIRNEFTCSSCLGTFL